MSAVSPTECQRVAGLALALVREHEPCLEPLLRIEWSARFTSRLGDASYLGEKMIARAVFRSGSPRGLGREPMARVRFSIPLWERAGREEQDNTIAHEIAHLIVFHRWQRGDYGRKPSPHGREWQQVMRSLGYTPKRTHNVDRTGLVRRRSRHALHCHACGKAHPVGPTRFRRQQRHERAGFPAGGYYCRCSTRGQRNYLHTTPNPNLKGS